MVEKSSPHDSFFKLVFSDTGVVEDFLREFVGVDVKVKSLKPTEKKTKHKKFFLDLAFEAEFKKQKAEVYIVFEHKSYPDNMAFIQIFTYALSIWEEEIRKGEKLTPVIPVLFYHGKKNYNIPENFSEYFKTKTPYNPEFKITVFNTNNTDDKKLLQNCGNLFLCSAIYTMKHIFDSIESLKPVSFFYKKLDKNRYALIVDYIAKFKNEKEEDIIEKIIPKGDKMTIYEKWEKEWAQKGLERGLQQGLEKGLQQGLQQGLEKGLQQGLEKGLKQGEVIGKILAFYEMGVDIKTISSKLGMSEDEVIKILKER